MPSARGMKVVVAMVLATGVAGFFSGIAQNARDSRGLGKAGPLRGEPVAARSYLDMRERKHGPNAEIYGPELQRLTEPPDLFAPFSRTDADRAATAQARASRRAYDGAPPTVPHAVVQLEAPDCLACHEQGARIAGKVAAPMSHPHLDSCTQCHVPSRDPRAEAGELPLLAENTFRGLAAQSVTTRAWPGAPPTVPHRTFMRQSCDACHGPLGQNGIRSTHPWRQSCSQCHAPSAQLEGRPPAPVAAFGEPG